MSISVLSHKYLSSFQLTEMLLQNGANPNVGDQFGNTPLHRSASKGNTKITKLLLSYNADTYFQDTKGDAPL
jgi:ankyrin repeat protein